MKLQTTREIGEIGEQVACEYLKRRNFLIVARNYYKKWGEIDIIAAKDNITHFVEVKSITGTGREHRPEENVHEMKTRRLKRVIQSYLLEKRYGPDVEFKFHVIVVYLNQRTKKARVIFMENIIL